VVEHISVEGDGSNLLREEAVPQYHEQAIDICRLKAVEWVKCCVFEEQIEDACCDKDILICVCPLFFEAGQDSVAGNFIPITVVL
jgi:hypothetical protein